MQLTLGGPREILPVPARLGRARQARELQRERAGFAQQGWDERAKEEAQVHGW